MGFAESNGINFVKPSNSTSMNITANITQSFYSIGIPSTPLIVPATFLFYLGTCPQHFTSAANQQHHILVPRNNPITSPQMRPLYHLPQSIPTSHFIGAMKYKYTLNITPPSIHVSSPCPTFPAGAYSAGLITEDERLDIVQNSCPGAGACGGMYTANTMASAIEALGMSLPYSSSLPAEDPMKLVECRLAGRWVGD